MPGDRLVRIESRPVNVMERMQWWAGSDKEMLEVLNGPQGSNVALVLARSRDDTEYQVVLKRHVPAADQETNTSATMRAVHLPNSQNLYDGPPVSKTRLTVMGGVGVAVRRGDEQDDYGPVLYSVCTSLARCTEKSEQAIGCCQSTLKISITSR